MRSKILVSACLLGQPVRYDGGDLRLEDALLRRWQDLGLVVPLCPEVAAGLPVPRPPAEIAPEGDGDAVVDGRAQVLEQTGADVTEPFLAGARMALRTAQANGCRFALLADGSPSCGSTWIYGGRHDGSRRAGQGVVAALLRQNGIDVFAPHQITELAARLDG